MVSRLRQASHIGIAVRLLVASLILMGACEGAASALDQRAVAPLVKPVTELPGVKLESGSSGAPDGVASLPKSATGTVSPSVRLLVRAATGDSVAGALAPFLVLVANSGQEPTTPGRPVVLTVHAPAGLRLERVTNLDGLPNPVELARAAGSASAAGWRCAGAITVRCELVQAAGAVPASLPGRSSSELLFTFRVADSLAPGSAGIPVTGAFSISAPGNVATSDTSVRAGLTIAKDRPRPQLFPDLGGSAAASSGGRATETADVLVVGSGAAHPGHGRPSITLTHLLPPGLVAGWRASGSGWSCSGADPACTYAGTVAVGSLAPRLTLTYVVRPASVQAMRLAPGGPGRVVQWALTVDGNGDSPSTPATFPALIAVTPPPGSTLMPSVLAAGGIDELLPGTGTTLDVRLTNLGGGATAGTIVLHGTLPAGAGLATAFELGRGAASAPWPCTTRPSGSAVRAFTCRSSPGALIPAASSIELTLPVSVARGALPRYGAFAVQASAANQISGASARTATVPLIILPGNVGFPALTLSEATGSAASALALRPAGSGAPAALLTGAPFAERLDVRDAGGAAIAAGSEARLVQSFARGVRVRAIRKPPGWSCAATGALNPLLSCTVRFARALAPAASLTGPTVLLVAANPSAAVDNWPASIRLTGPGAPGAARLPVLVTVTRSGPSLVPNVTTLLVPTAGGTGRFRVVVANTGSAATSSRVRLTLRLPAGVRLTSLQRSSWSCSRRRGSAVCTSFSGARAGARLPGLGFAAAFAPRTANRTLTIVASVGDGGGTPRGPAVASAQVTPRGVLRAVIKAPDTVAFADQPLVSSQAALVPTTVTLEGDGSGGSGVGVSYSWRQLCTTAADGGRARGVCAGITPRVRWRYQPAGVVRPATADVAFIAPPVRRLARLVFQLTVSDGSATSSALVRVSEIPPTPARFGFTFTHAQPGRTPTSGPSTLHLDLPRPAAPLGGASPGAPDVRPAQRSASARRASRGHAVRPRQQGGSGSLPGAFCDLVRDAANGRSSFTQAFGPISFNLDHVKLSGSGCAADTTLSFSDSSIRLSSFLSATGVAASINKDGVTLTAATITGPEAWHAPKFTLGSKGLSLPFGSGTSVEVDGSISGDGLAFVPLPAGWSGSTTLSFTATSDSTAFAVSANGTGPASSAGPDSPRPKVTIDGALNGNGTFSLDVALTGLIQLQGHSFDVTGHVARPTADGPLEIKLTGQLREGFDVVPGLRIDALSASMEPTADSLGLKGNGTVLLTSGSSSVGVGVKFAYDNPRNWSLTADGGGTGSWNPLPGLVIGPKDFSGSITAKDDKYDFSLKLAPAQAWKPTDAVTVSGLKLTLSNTCQATGATCPTNARLFLTASGHVDVSLPGTTVSTDLAGVLALPSGAFSVAATLTKPIDLGAGISIDSGKLELSRGLPAPAGEALLADSTEPDGLRLEISGSAKLPLVGKVPTIQAAFSSRGFSVAAQLGSYKLPGAGGEGSSLGGTVLGWSSFPTSLKVGGTTVALPANTFEVTGAFDAPKWLKDLLGLPTDFHARATGALNTTNGDFGLRVDVDLPKTTYIYGDASSASSLRLSTVYVEIARKGADFNIALGGTAKLAIAASSSLSVSDIDLGLALGFSAQTQTISGTLTIQSRNGWQSAFGVRDLTLFDLALSFQLDLKTLIPGIGFGATAVLPASVRDPLGIPSGVKTTLVANLTLTNPCLGLAITDPAKSGQNVLDIERKGILTAKQFELEIAPSGCTVGQFRYEPGLSVQFDGAIAGVAVAVHAHVGVSPFAVDGSLDVGEFQVGGMTVQKTHIDLAISSSKFQVNFSGGVKVFTTTVQLSGGVNREGDTTKIDFHGSIDNLSFGDTVKIKRVAVDAHVETGPKPKVSFNAEGSIELLGSTATAKFTLNLDNGTLTRAIADVTANITIGGAGAVVLDGKFKLDYAPSSGFAIDATVSAKVGSFNLGAASVKVRPSSVELSADLSYGSIFKASLRGAVYFGNVPKGTTVVGPDGKAVAASAGDFLLSAKDVSLNLGGFQARGTVELGRASGQVWGKVDTRIQLLGSAGDNSVAIAGAFNSGGDFSFAGTGNLNLVGVTAKLNVKVARSGGTVTVHGDTTVGILGSSISLSGDFRYDGGSPRVRLSGSGTLVVGGYRLADGSFTFSNFPADAGLFANVRITAGSVLNATGRLTIVGDRYYLGVSANLDLKVTTVQGSVIFTNCTDPSCRTGKGATTLDASATLIRDKFSFGISVHVSSNGSFSATASSPVTGEFRGRTGDITILAVAFYADFHYHMTLTVTSSSPYIALSGSGGGNLYGKSWGYRGGWSWGWSGWSHIFGINASIQTNPFKVCGGVSVWGVWFSGCI